VRWVRAFSFPWRGNETLKCRCEQCGQKIEYPDDLEGRYTDCPACGKATKLENIATRIKVELDQPPASKQTDNNGCAGCVVLLIYLFIAMLILAGCQIIFGHHF
jgi:hypothetical protein